MRSSSSRGQDDLYSTTDFLKYLSKPKIAVANGSAQVLYSISIDFLKYLSKPKISMQVRYSS